MLQVSQLHQYYGGSHILRGVDFSARQGEVTCLLGRNGVGKTTLLKCLMGLIPARSGEVRWQDQNITHRKPHQRVQAGVAYVPQGREIFPRLTVEENLLMGLSRFPAREAQQVPEEIYQLFPVLKTMKQRRGGDLSGGQQQKLAIAKLLLAQPRLLFLDEPTKGLDPASSADLSRIVKALAAEGKTIVMVTHDLDFAFATADEVSMLFDGELACTEPVQDFFDNNLIYRPNSECRFFGQIAEDGAAHDE